MTGIVNLSIVPLRLAPAEQSEMVTQLLFGELVEIIETTDRWLYVRNQWDDYCAWVDRKMIKLIEDQAEIDPDPFILSYPITEAYYSPSNARIYLPAGSRIHHYYSTHIVINSQQYHIDSFMMLVTPSISSEKIIEVAYQFLNAPYLWGGKSVLGFDCSGFIQVLFSIFNFQLPRDASQQVERGELISFINLAKAGDLAFFENQEGKIIHVGLLLSSNQIIHASGCVRIDTIDAHGIVCSLTGEYTHKLRVVKRLING